MALLAILSKVKQKILRYFGSQFKKIYLTLSLPPPSNFCLGSFMLGDFNFRIWFGNYLPTERLWGRTSQTQASTPTSSWPTLTIILESSELLGLEPFVPILVNWLTDLPSLSTIAQSQKPQRLVWLVVLCLNVGTQLVVKLWFKLFHLENSLLLSISL